MARKATLPTGLYEVDGVFYTDVTDPAGKRHRKSTDTSDLALAKQILEKRRAHLVAAANGLETHDLTPAAFTTKYLDYAKLNKAKQTVEQDRRRLELFFAFVKVPKLSQVRPEHFHSWARSRLEEKHDGTGETRLKRSTVRHDVDTVRTAFRWASRQGFLERNPVERSERLRPDVVSKRVEYLTKEERDQLLAACGAPVDCHGRGGKGKGNTRARRTPLLPLAAIACYAGLRLSEILHLDWADLDFEKAEIHVRMKPGEGFQTKTRAERTVPMFGALKAILEPLRLAAGPCFTTRSGKRYTRRNALRELGRMFDAVPLGERELTFILLRHTFASILVSEGIPIFAVSRWLGHTSVRTTERHYAALIPNTSLVAQAAAALTAARPSTHAAGAA